MAVEPSTNAATPPVLVVVARPEAGLRATPAGPTAKAADARSLAAILDEVRAPLRTLFGTSEERLLHERSLLPEPADAMADGATPDLSVYYRVDAPAAELPALAARLREHEGVLGAYVKPPAALAGRLNAMTARAEEAPAATPSFEGRQGYLGPAPGGVDARFAWRRSGGLGSGFTVVDVELAWRFTHEDLVQNQGGALAGSSSTELDARNHGTAVLGVFGADHNGRGVAGICPGAVARAVPVGTLDTSEAIRVAANALRPGDLILIELHRPGPRFDYEDREDQRGFISVEWWPDDFAAIRYATRRGLVVVEAAGNGAENLDDRLYDVPAEGFPPDWRNPFRRGAHDSGAILVGAGAPPPGTHGEDWGADRSRLDFSNHGAAVDVQGWGRSVTTTGYGDLQGGSDQNAWYTDDFAGTSSASPIVAGALGCLQGITRAIGRTPRTPAEARLLLRMTGTPQREAPHALVSQRIGSRPNLRQLVAEVTSRRGAAVASWGQDPLDIFAVGRDRALYQKLWDPDAPDGAGWARLGGVVEAPVVVVPEPGRLDLFAIGANRCVYHKARTADGWWPSHDAWEPLGDTPVESGPAGVSWAPARLDVFVAGADRALYHKWWDGTAWWPSQSGAWERLGGTMVGAPLAVSRGPRRLDVFALGHDRAVHHLTFDGGWAPWERLGGPFEGGLAAVCQGPDRIDLLAVGEDRAVHHKAWTGGAWQPAQGWTGLGGTVEGAPAVVSWGPDRLDVFVVGTNRNLYHKWLTEAGWQGTQAGGWERMGGDVLASPSVTSRGPRHLDVVAAGTNLALYLKTFDGTAWQPSLLRYTPLDGRALY